MKGAANPMKKAVKQHRIKSKKTRLMVDIYKTALYCTVEEVDKRNGTSWATNSNFPDQEVEFQAEDIKEKAGFIHEVAGNEGDVYIDTNGKKVRIVSMPNLSTLDDSEGRKLKERRKGSKLIMEKKKNGRKFCPNKRKVCKKETRGEEENVAIKETCKKEDGPTCACSKQTNLAKECKLLERREHNNAGSNLNLKSKFSDHKKSRDHCLSIEEESANDSLKHKSIVEEDKKKKSNSSNEDSCSGGLEITSESNGTDEVPFLSDQVGIEGSFMKLLEYYKFDSRDEDIAIRLNTEDCMNDTDKQRISYIEDLDPIPIPPTPGADMVVYEEELEGNSSLTNTSKVQSSGHDNTDVITDSPISNVSNPSFASDLRPVGAEKGSDPSDKIRQPCCCSKKVGSCHQASREQALESYGIKPLADASVKLPVYKDCESAISHTSVIRLMGVNLTVVRTDDDPPCTTIRL